MVNFFKPSKDDGTVLHLTKSGKWEKCTIPVGCTRHIDPKSFKGNFNVAEEPNEWSEEAYNNRSTALSVDDYNGYDPDEDYDPFDDMKMNVNPALIAQHNAYELKRVNYHYTCPNCGVPFDPAKTVEVMDEQVAVHDCDNLTPVEMHKKRKAFKETYGVSKFIDMTEFVADHDICRSYQTACADCAEKHELQLYGLFSREELSNIVRKDSMFYNPERKQILTTTDVNGEEINFISHVVSGVLSDFPESQKWQYLPNKSERQLQLERDGVNYGNHIEADDYDNCRVCGQQVYDMYCMDCWVPSGYLLED